MKSGVTIQIKVDDKELKSLFQGVVARMDNLTPALKIIGEIVRTSVVRNFEKSGRPKKWKKLTPYTLARKKGTKILIEQGMAGGLMGSISYKAMTDRVRIGTNKKYAAIHQFGGFNGRSKIPARPYLMVQDEDWPEINAELKDYIVGVDNAKSK